MQGDEKKPGESEVWKTGGEARAAAYTEAEVPEGKDCPTIDGDRVRLVPPSLTPTVRLADLASRSGPRAPDQMVKPKPKGLVELPEGRPVTKMQLIEIDPEFLLELEQGLFEKDAGAEGPPAEPVSTPVAKRPGRSGILMGVAIVVTAAVVALAAMRPGREPAPATTANTTATVTPSAAPSTTAMPSATAGPSASARAAKTPNARGPKPTTLDHPHDEAPPKRAPAAATSRLPEQF